MNKLIILIIAIIIIAFGIGAFVVLQKPALPEEQKQTESPINKIQKEITSSFF